MIPALCAGILSLSGILPAHAEEERAAPTCNVRKMDTDESLNLQRYHGKVVYVDFWASWCGPCVKSFPFMNQLYRELNDQGLEVLGINLDENIDDASAFLAKHPAEFTIAVDPDKTCPKDFGVHGMPTSYLVDRHGMIRLVHLGFRPGEASLLRTRIEQLLNEQSTVP